MEVSYLIFLFVGVFSSTIGSTVKSTAELSLEEMVRQLSAKMEEMEIEKQESRKWRNDLSAKLQELEETFKVFENSSLNFLKDCANSSYVSELEENLKKLETKAKNDLGTLQSELSTRLEKLEGRCVHCGDVPEMKKTLTNHSSLLSKLTQQLWEVENSCAGEPPSIPNGKPLKFDRKHKSFVQYECDQDFVVTGNSTVFCENGKWEGHPSICSILDTTFTLVADLSGDHRITCYSDRYSQNIEFSRVLDTGTGIGLPTGSRLEGNVLSFTETPWSEKSGAYECRFHVDNSTAGLVFPFQAYGAVLFQERAKVAILGETVELKVETIDKVDKSKLRWRYNGVLVPSWEGRTVVEISGVQSAHAGIYECHEKGDRSSAHAVFGLTVRRCEKNRYGGNCEQECPVCYNGGSCHDLIGVCICPAGFTGKNCESACGENQVSGGCTNVCLGQDCSWKLFCKPDSFGCSCFPGFRGYWCDEQCDPGWYGANCMQPCHCDGDCDRFTGTCSGGCSPGWTGPSCLIEESCAGEPPSILNGKPLKFDREPKSAVHYECERDLFVTGNSTVRCEYGKWVGHPPLCSYFDTTFTLVANLVNNRSIACYSDRYSQNVKFSRVLDTGTGAELPTGSRLEGRVLSFTNTPREDVTGAYECKFHFGNRSAGIVVPLQGYGVIAFERRPQLAHIGGTVLVGVVIESFFNRSELRWRHNGVLVPSWDGRTNLQISGPDKAGIYECYREGKRSVHQALYRLIVRKCKRNRYGENCEQECPVCYNGGVCHDLLGVCVCPAGFTGNNCELACGKNHVSGDCANLCLRDDCKEQLFCKPDPYGCSCFPGFTGLWCDEQCSRGWYGAGCMQRCHCDGDCDRFTGACSGACSPGWAGPSCQD